MNDDSSGESAARPSYTASMRSLRAATSPRAPAVARVRQRLDRALVPATRELSTLPGPRPGAAGRVAARLARRPEATPAFRPIPLMLGATAFAMAAAVVLGGDLFEPETVPSEIILSGLGGYIDLSEHVHASHEGQGHVRTRGDTMIIDWEIGRLTLDVDPGQGAVVEVHTPEGTVRVVGTRLTVERSALGSTVTVEHGLVTFACLSLEGSREPERTVGAGDAAECWPVTAEGLLNRARTLGAGADILATLTRGLSLASDGPVAAELWSLRSATLLTAGDDLGALDSAERALAAGPDLARTIELHRTAARLSLIRGYCDRAAPHLDALPELTPDELAYLARCNEP